MGRGIRWVGLLGLLLWAGVAARQAPDAQIARASVALLERTVSRDSPGATVLVLSGDREVVRAARGSANLELGVAMRPEHVFQIASITKVYVAALVVALAQDGKLALDDSLSHHLPDFPNASKISLRQLLTHTSGVSDVVARPQPGFSRRDLDTATLLEQIAERELDFAPGTRWKYSNAGYIVLAAVVERVTGTAWHEALAERLLRPQGFDATRYGASTGLVPGRVNGYAHEGANVVNARYLNLSAISGAGSLLSTGADVARFLRALALGRVVGSHGFESMRARPATRLPGESGRARYGLGLYLWTVRGEPMVGHTGQVNGFASAAGYLPSIDVTLVILANDESFDARASLRRLAGVALGAPYATVSGSPSGPGWQSGVVGAWSTGGGMERVFQVIDGRVHLVRQDRPPMPLQWTADGALHFSPDELTYFLPVRNAAGDVVRIDYFEDGDGPAVPLTRPPDS